MYLIEKKQLETLVFPFESSGWMQNPCPLPLFFKMDIMGKV
jgi:hypothetical protein